MISDFGFRIGDSFDLGFGIADLTAKRIGHSVRILRIIVAMLFTLQYPASSIEQPATINDFNDLNDPNELNDLNHLNELNDLNDPNAHNEQNELNRIHP